MIGYLKAKSKKTTKSLEPSHPEINKCRFIKCEEHDFYGEQGINSRRCAWARGNAVSTNCFVDVDHTGNKVTRRLQSGLLLLVSQVIIQMAAGTIWVMKEDGKTNLADILTKPLPQVKRIALQQAYVLFWWRNGSGQGSGHHCSWLNKQSYRMP